MRGLTLTVQSLVNPIDLLHIYMAMGNERANPHSTKPWTYYTSTWLWVMRGLTLTLPNLVNPTNVNRVHVPMWIRSYLHFP